MRNVLALMASIVLLAGCSRLSAPAVVGPDGADPHGKPATMVQDAPPATAEEASQRGLTFFGTGNAAQAVVQFSRAIELKPDDAPALLFRGRCYHVLGQDDLAASDFSEVVRLDPNSAEAYTARAAAYLSLHKHEEAVADAEKAVRLAPDFVEARRRLVEAYEQLGRTPPSEPQSDVTYRKIAPGGAAAVTPFDATSQSPCGTDVVVPDRPASQGTGVVTLTDHGNVVKGVAFSPDGKWLASAGHDQTVRLYNASTLKLEATFQGEMDCINALAFSPDSQTVAATSFGTKAVVLWDVKTRTRRAILPGHGAYNPIMAFSPDGQLLAVMYMDSDLKGEVVLWDAATWQPRTRLKLDGQALEALAFSPDGKTLAVGGAGETLRAGLALWSKGKVDLWDWAAEKKTTTYRDPNGSVQAIAFSPDGTALASASLAGTVSIWGLTDPKQTILDLGDGILTCVAFSPDGRLVAVGSQRKWVCVWDRTAATLRTVLSGHSQGVEAVGFSPDGQRLASASRDRTVKVWAVIDAPPPARRLAKLQRFRYPGEILTLAVSPDGSKIAVGGSANSIVVWDLADPEADPQTLTGHAHPVCDLRFAADGKTLISAASSRQDLMTPGEIKVWDLGSGRVRKSLTGFAEGVERIALSPDDRLLASVHRTAKDSLARLWNLESGKVVCTLKSREELFSAAFAPDGRTIATGGSTDIKLWDLPVDLAGQELSNRPPIDAPHVWIEQIAFSPDGTTLAAGGAFDQTSTLWDVKTLTKKAMLTGKVPAFSPDGKTIVTAGAKDAPLQPLLWDGASGRLLLTFQDAHADAISCVGFFPNGKRLMTACRDGTLKMWDPKTGRES